VFEDALSLQQVLATAVPDDLHFFGPDAQALILSTKAQIDQIVSDGPEQFEHRRYLDPAECGGESH
jgi:hypothetical protein